MALLDVRVAAKRLEAEGICSYDLVLPGGGTLPEFSAGAHIDVHVPGGWTRQYSLCNGPNERGAYRIGVLREDAGRGGSRAMHENVAVGDRLQISAPRNLFALADSAEPSLLLAGGIGITPLLAMAQALARRAAPFELHYCNRTLARAAFLDRLDEQSLAPSVHLHFDDGPTQQRLDFHVLLEAHRNRSQLYVCGPRGFINAVLDMARKQGWSPQRLHFEFFNPERSVQASDTAFQVRLNRSGLMVSVSVGQTVLQALAAQGVEIPSSCEQGICGTCITRVVEGVPDHRDSFLMPEEQARNDCFMPCCSRSRSPVLVLDV